MPEVFADRERGIMNKIVVTTHNGVTQHARLLTFGRADYFDHCHHQVSPFLTGIDYQWSEYHHIQDMTPFWLWYENLTNVPTTTLCQIAVDCTEHNQFKGWAALTLLGEDTPRHSDDELVLAIEAAEAHSRTLVGRNALQLLQWELDDREFGW